MKGPFPETRWSLVLAARTDGVSDRSEGAPGRALEELCQLYWYPLFAYVRGFGKPAQDAEDLVQGFFERLIAGDYLRRADSGKGKLRTFLLVALRRFMADDHDRSRALKRGGGQPPVSIDQARAEENYSLEPFDGVTPEVAFDRNWALTLLEAVMNELRAEYEAQGRGEFFAAMCGALTGAGTEMPYAELAEQLGTNEGALKVAVFRLRQRYRQLLFDRIADTVESPEEVEGEISYLCELFAAKS